MLSLKLCTLNGKLHPDKCHAWNIQLLNIFVAKIARNVVRLNGIRMFVLRTMRWQNSSSASLTERTRTIIIVLPP